MPDKNGLRIPFPVLGILVGILVQIIMLATLWGTTQANIRQLKEQRIEDNARNERYWLQQDERFKVLEGLIRDLYNLQAGRP